VARPQFVATRRPGPRWSLGSATNAGEVSARSLSHAAIVNIGRRRGGAPLDDALSPVVTVSSLILDLPFRYGATGEVVKFVVP
jgi:hypothetical protein